MLVIFILSYLSHRGADGETGGKKLKKKTKTSAEGKEEGATGEGKKKKKVKSG